MKKRCVSDPASDDWIGKVLKSDEIGTCEIEVAVVPAKQPVRNERLNKHRTDRVKKLKEFKNLLHPSCILRISKPPSSNG